MFDDEELIEVVQDVIEDLKKQNKYKITIHIRDMEQIINYIKRIKDTNYN
jgi:5-carboxymethyl-2-hydroxymuconate isomerase